MSQFSSNGVSQGVGEFFPTALVPESLLVPQRILLVEDRPLLQELFRCSFEGENIEIHASNDGRKALETFINQPFDIVVTELAIPGISGTHLAKLVKAHRPGTPVIILTGFCGETMPSLVETKEVDGIIYKPFKPSKLKATIQDVMLMVNG
jgi:DNA-binding response OmpR family regulator